MTRKPYSKQSKKATERARNLREDSTFPERLLWGRLRGRQLAGLKFRRQHSIGPFVVDFFCHDARLVVELDGMSHDGRAREDAERTGYLRGQGLRVFRITNDEVLADLEAALVGILRECGIDPETGRRTGELRLNSPENENGG